MIHWLIDSLIDCLIVWLVDWLTFWLIDWLIDLFIGWLINWLTDWLMVMLWLAVSSSQHVRRAGRCGDLGWTRWDWDRRQRRHYDEQLSRVSTKSHQSETPQRQRSTHHVSYFSTSAALLSYLLTVLCVTDTFIISLNLVSPCQS